MSVSTTDAVLIFLGSLILMSISSLVLASTIDHIGARLHLSEGLMGLVTALGANSPEISAAVVALVGHSHDLGLGVILGSNVFNLAMLLGLSAVISGRVVISRQAVSLNGGVAVAFSIITVALVLKTVSAWLGLVLLLVVFVPYVALIALSPGYLAKVVPAGRIYHFLAVALERPHDKARQDTQPRQGEWTDALVLVPGLASTILGSIGMVYSAVILGERWGIPARIIGVLVLAGLTGVPNVLAAVRLALRSRGSAVASEALNSNSLNVLVGLALPVLILGEGQLSSLTQMAGWWFLGMTIASVALLFVRRGLGRRAGFGLVAVYGIFVVIVCLWR